MTGAAIASAGMSVIGGIGARKDAKAAQAASDRDAAYSREQAEAMYGMIESNQGNVDALQEFLNSMGEEGMEYAQGLMDDWESTFGGIEDNMSDYYNNLDPEKFATGEKARFKQNLDKQMGQYNETMAASGLQSAGMKAQTAKEAMFKTAEANSSIDLASEEYVANEKMNFLSFGENRRSAADKAMGNAIGNKTALGEKGFGAQTDQNTRLAQAAGGMSDFYGESAQKYGESAAGYNQAAGNYFGSAMKSGISAWNGMGGTSAFGSGGSNGLANTELF